MPHRVLTLEEVALYLHLKPGDVEQLVRRQEIPYEYQGERLIFRQREVDAWASRRILGMPRKKLADYHKEARPHDLSRGSLIIVDLLCPARIHLDVPARTKPSLLREMTVLANQTGLLYDPDDLLRSLEEREALCSTALEDGIALLHPRHHEPYMFEDSFIVLGRTAHPLPFGAPDGGKTDLFFLICCQSDRIHLHVLARICMMCRATDLIAALRQAADADAVFHALQAAENAVVSNI